MILPPHAHLALACVVLRQCTSLGLLASQACSAVLCFVELVETTRRGHLPTTRITTCKEYLTWARGVRTLCRQKNTPAAWAGVRRGCRALVQAPVVPLPRLLDPILMDALIYTYAHEPDRIAIKYKTKHLRRVEGAAGARRHLVLLFLLVCFCNHAPLGPRAFARSLGHLDRRSRAVLVRMFPDRIVSFAPMPHIRHLMHYCLRRIVRHNQTAKPPVTDHMAVVLYGGLMEYYLTINI